MKKSIDKIRVFIVLYEIYFILFFHQIDVCYTIILFEILTSISLNLRTVENVSSSKNFRKNEHYYDTKY